MGSLGIDFWLVTGIVCLGILVSVTTFIYARFLHCKNKKSSKRLGGAKSETIRKSKAYKKSSGSGGSKSKNKKDEDKLKSQLLVYFRHAKTIDSPILAIQYASYASLPDHTFKIGQQTLHGLPSIFKHFQDFLLDNHNPLDLYNCTKEEMVQFLVDTSSVKFRTTQTAPREEIARGFLKIKPGCSYEKFLEGMESLRKYGDKYAGKLEKQFVLHVLFRCIVDHLIPQQFANGIIQLLEEFREMAKQYGYKIFEGNANNFNNIRYYLSPKYKDISTDELHSFEIFHERIVDMLHEPFGRQVLDRDQKLIKNILSFLIHIVLAMEVRNRKVYEALINRLPRKAVDHELKRLFAGELESLQIYLDAKDNQSLVLPMIVFNQYFSRNIGNDLPHHELLKLFSLPGDLLNHYWYILLQSYLYADFDHERSDMLEFTDDFLEMTRYSGTFDDNNDDNDSTA